MKILLVTSSFFPVLGGLQEAVSQLAKEFQAMGHDVAVVTNRYPRNLKRYEIIEGIPVARMLFPGFYLASLNPQRIMKFCAGLILGFVNYFRLLLLLKRKRPDVVNIHFLGSPAPIAMTASKLLGIRCVISLHGDDVEGLPHRSGIDRWLFKKTLTASDYVTACSRYLLDKAKKMVPVIEKKSLAIHNGIKTEEFRNIKPYKHTRPYVFAAGRFVYKKGMDVLLAAYRSALDKGLDVDLILAGDGPEREKLLSMAADLGLSFLERASNKKCAVEIKVGHANTVFWGRATRDEMKSLMKGCEVFVIPSRLEPFGIVAMEAFAAGKKVVASRTGGLPEIVQEGINGYLARVDDVEDLAFGIRKAVLEKSDGVPMDMTEHSWRKVALNYLAVFEMAKR